MLPVIQPANAGFSFFEEANVPKVQEPTTTVAEEVVQTPEQIAEAEAEDFSKGFDKVQSTSVTPSPETTPAKATVEAAPPPPVDDPGKKPATLIAGMTEEELKAALARGGSVKQEVDAEVRKVYSKIGEINRTVQELAKNLSAGKSGRKVTAEMLKRVNDELPGLGTALAEDLSAILGASETAQVAAEAKGVTFDPETYFAEKLSPALQAMETRINDAAQAELLEFMHPNYVEVLKTKDFKDWLQTLPEDRRKTVVHSPRAVVAGAAITEFKAYQEKAKKARDRQTNRLEAAITPKTGGGAPAPTTQDDEAAFAAGFTKAAKKA